MARARVFIDGEAGTTGLQIRDRLAALSDTVEVISIDEDKRKDTDARQAMMRQADVMILCLPDEAARQSVALADGLGDAAPRIIDASTAHRIHPDWVYGFAEMAHGQRQRIAEANRVANPGCYATGAIALLKPLIYAGLLPEDFPVAINAVSGYSGGGKAMIAAHDAGEAPVFELYGLNLGHKHVPEIMAHTGLATWPTFVPSVGNFAQGMLVSLPLPLGLLGSTPPSLSDLHDVFIAYYNDDPEGQVRFMGAVGADDGEDGAETAHIYESFRLHIDPAVGRDDLQVWLFGREGAGADAEGGQQAPDQALLVARLDNLGKGAAGAAVQNLKLMIGA